MVFLLIDNSNTRTKLALSTAEELLDWRDVIATAELSEEALARSLRGVQWEAAIICSVVPDKAKVIASFLGDKPQHFLSCRSELPIGIDYPKPEQIGADRLANAAAAATFHGTPAVVLDFGTAVTFDVIASGKKNAQGSYLGGVIAPGLASMTEGLAKRTALLPHIELEEPRCAIGRSTEDAMLSGAVHGYRGLVREILSKISEELTGESEVIATGGDAELITRGLPEIKHCEPQLTLEGLRIVGKLNI